MAIRVARLDIFVLLRRIGKTGVRRDAKMTIAAEA